jgi:hypothetical protein
MHTMLKKALLLALVLPVLSTTAASSESTSAVSSETMQLSSWQSEVRGNSIVGGVQTITIVNPATSTTQDIVFHLEEPPCACSIASASPSAGTIGDGVWTIDNLSPGTTVTLELTYVDHK